MFLTWARTALSQEFLSGHANSADASAFVRWLSRVAEHLKWNELRCIANSTYTLRNNKKNSREILGTHLLHLTSAGLQLQAATSGFDFLLLLSVDHHSDSSLGVTMI